MFSSSETSVHPVPVETHTDRNKCMARVAHRVLLSSDLILSCICLFCSLLLLISNPPTTPMLSFHLRSAALTLDLPPQCRRLTVCRSPAWPNVCGELRSASSWRTTVCPCRGRRSLRRCQRRHWQNTTSAVCWTRPRTPTWAPGKSVKKTWIHAVYFEFWISIFPPVIVCNLLCEFPLTVFLHSKTIHNQGVLTVVIFLCLSKMRFQVEVIEINNSVH